MYIDKDSNDDYKRAHYNKELSHILVFLVLPVAILVVTLYPLALTDLVTDVKAPPFLL